MTTVEKMKALTRRLLAGDFGAVPEINALMRAASSAEFVACTLTMFAELEAFENERPA